MPVHRASRVLTAVLLAASGTALLLVASTSEAIPICGICTPSGPCERAFCDGDSCVKEPKPSGTTCRAAAGECDLGGRCDGTAVTCPASRKKAKGTVCACDSNACTSDVCDGVNVACGHFAFPVGTPCGPGLVCSSTGCVPSK